MTVMPWDRWQPEGPPPVPPMVNEPELPYKSPLPPDLKDIMAEAFSQALGNQQGTVEVADRGKELVTADARNRSKRTFIQGLLIDLVFALFAVLGTVTDFDPLEKTAWITLGVLVGKTLIQSAFAYIMRLKVTPTITEKGDKLALVPVPEPLMHKMRNYQ